MTGVKEKKPFLRTFLKVPSTACGRTVKLKISLCAINKNKLFTAKSRYLLLSNAAYRMTANKKYAINEINFFR